MIHLSNFLRYEFISDVDLLCLFFSKYVIFYQLLFFVSFLCIQVVGKKRLSRMPCLYISLRFENGDCFTRGDQKVLQLLTLVNKMVKING